MTERLNTKFNWGLIMILVSVFQIITCSSVIFKDGNFSMAMFSVYAGYILVEWIYFFIASAFFSQNNFELETIAFLFSGIGLTNAGSVYNDFAPKQFVSVLLGLVTFIAMLAVLRRTDIVMKLRTPVAAGAILLLILNLVLAKATNGALNWITIGGVSLQPSELVKLAFIFVGAASLDKLQTAKSLTKYLVFSFTCVGALFLMKDFGTALIFFFTFIIIAFMRSGDVRTIALVCVAAALGAIMIIYFRPTVASRFSTYRHVWENMNGTGMQQTRTLIYSSSGGLLGLGVGNGLLRDTFASTTDLVFGMICEEWGMIIALVIVLSYVFVLLFSIKVAQTTRSAFYAIAACASAGLILFQTSLNIFGVTDILPLTGVTLPFISRGGSSMICSWGLIAFIKSADIRTYPKLSQTILPDHPLYPPDIRFNRLASSARFRRYNRPPVNTGYYPNRNFQVNQPPTGYNNVNRSNDVPISGNANRQSSAYDIPIGRRNSSSRRNRYE
ncbi:MAG: FtsW/RodA/SpoVE family cell cycle protein [Ruminococcus sp.]|nr:FtsW/RodA/SpoVE family cell cycle protein [Candidatus Copronaster equi]